MTLRAPRFWRTACLFNLLTCVALAALQPGSGDRPPPLLLISLDGFGADYVRVYAKETPTLNGLMRQGVSARSLIPVFPSNTFPNHYSMVTGLYPSRHGIINNYIFDSELGTFFHYSRAQTTADPRWWGGEPIWVTAHRKGLKSACSFWIGSEAEIQGVRPTFWKPYDLNTPFEHRLDELLAWLTLPPEQRPSIITFYIEDTNSAGHRFGPESEGLRNAVETVDGKVKVMLERLALAGIPVNVIIVSDHGMTACGPDRVVILDDYIDLNSIQLDFEGSCVGLRPRPGTDVSVLMDALAKMPPEVKAYRSENLPPHFRTDSHSPRVPPIWIVPNESWLVARRAAVEAALKNRFDRGQHGYDPALASMQGILIAAGPSFVGGGTVIDAAENVHLYHLLCAALNIEAAANDGDDRLVRGMLRP
jgi:predicted AlkP superfamily pyrophosphatase or phosphodiesterase